MRWLPRRHLTAALAILAALTLACEGDEPPARAAPTSTPTIEGTSEELWFSQGFHREVACPRAAATAGAAAATAPCPPDAEPQPHYLGALDTGVRGPVAAVFAGNESGSLDRSACDAPLSIDAARDLLDQYEREGRLERPVSEVGAVGVRCWYGELSLEVTYDFVAQRRDADGALHPGDDPPQWLSHIEYRTHACPGAAVTPAGWAGPCPPEAPPHPDFLLAIDGPNGRVPVVRAEGDTTCLDAVPLAEIEQAALAVPREPALLAARCREDGAWDVFARSLDMLVPPRP